MSGEVTCPLAGQIWTGQQSHSVVENLIAPVPLTEIKTNKTKSERYITRT